MTATARPQRMRRTARIVAFAAACLALSVPFAHAAKTMGLTHVVTSHGFLDRIGVQVEGTQAVFLEDVRKTVGRVELLRTLVRCMCRC